MGWELEGFWEGAWLELATENSWKPVIEDKDIIQYHNEYIHVAAIDYGYYNLLKEVTKQPV